jgi:hypothetical protein
MMDQNTSRNRPRDLDHEITLKLYQEQETILWSHKIPLKPAVIALVDSETFWGRWEPQTRRILISRKLVTEHSWFSVRSILRHEMAHQYATEWHDSLSHHHDDLFRECCRKLGVPSEFSGASASLQDHPLEWKTLQREDSVQKLLNKVEKLLALATSSNEHEALLAMQKVREIYARHNLDESLRQGMSDSYRRMVHLLICHKKKRIEAHQSQICGILVGYFFVRVIFCKEFDAKTGEEYQAFQLIGSRENVLMAEYVYHFLLNQTDFLMRERRKQFGKLTPLATKSYRLGILQGFEAKLKESDRVGDQDMIAMGQALTAIKDDPRIEEYLETVFPRLQTRGSTSQYIDGNSYAAGTAAGGKITLHRGVSSQGGSSGKFLTHK